MASTSQSAPESKPIVVDGEDGNRTSLTESNSTLESSENVDTLNLLELYKKYEEVINKVFVNKTSYESILVKGKQLKKSWRRQVREHHTKTIRLTCGSKSISIVMIGAEDVKDKLTFPRFSACVAYNYYEKVVSKMTSLEEMIIPSLITGCSTLPPKEEYLKYNKLFCLAVNGVHFIPKMMKNAGYPVDLIGGVFVICILIDYTQYKKKHPDDNVNFQTFIKSDRHILEHTSTFKNAIDNYGANESVELLEKGVSFYMMGLYVKQGCTIKLKGQTSRIPIVYLDKQSEAYRQLIPLFRALKVEGYQLDEETVREYAKYAAVRCKQEALKAKQNKMI